MSERWQQLIALCVFRFGMSVSDFWQMTVPEFNALFAALSNDKVSQLPDRKCLNELMRAHPDTLMKSNSELLEPEEGANEQ